MLRDTIQQDMHAALKAKETKKLNVLRGVLSQVKNVEIDKHADLTDEEVVGVIRKQIKIINESIEMFTKGGRADLVDENKQELSILSAYLPAEMSEEDLEKKVQEVLDKNKDNPNRGILIGIVIRELKGLADSGRIAVLVNKLAK